jgi:hypothetical protein
MGCASPDGTTNPDFPSCTSSGLPPRVGDDRHGATDHALDDAARQSFAPQGRQYVYITVGHDPGHAFENFEQAYVVGTASATSSDWPGISV